MTDWRAFAGLSVLVVAAFLFLARATQGLLADDRGSDDVAGRRGGGEPAFDARPQADPARPPDTADPARPPDTADSTRPPDTVDSTRPPDTVDSTRPPDADPARPPDADPARPPDADRDPGGRARRAPGPTDVDIGDLGPGALLANVLLTHGVLAGLVAGGAVLWQVPPAALGLSAPTAATLWTGLAAGAGLYLLNELGTAGAESLGVDPDESLRELLAPGSAVGWALLLAGVLPVVAVAEELLFRAALVGALSTGLGVSPWALAVASSAAFGVGHGAQGRAGVAVTGLLGFALAALFVVTGSLLVVVVAHYVVNAAEFLVHEALGVQF